MKIKLLNPAQRKRAKRYAQCYEDIAAVELTSKKDDFFN
jgi:hypothetical protein